MRALYALLPVGLPDASVAVIRCAFVGVTIADDLFADQWKVMESGMLESVAAALEAPE